MNHLKYNILANLIGQGWGALMQLLFVPLYIRFMGMEAYGLIGFYAMLQGTLQILDLGLSPTMMRELARYSSQSGKEHEMRDFVRTLEVGYWIIGMVIGLAIVTVSSTIAQSWINASAIPTVTVQRAVWMMGIVSFLQWPISFYQGGFMGLQRQVLFNTMKMLLSTLGAGGSVLVLWLISPTITSFLKWQVLVSAIQVSLFAFFLWRSLPARGHTPRFNKQLLRNISKFAAGMSGLTITAIILTQLDKIILSKLLNLETFGYYVLAGVVTGGLSMITIPFFNALFPRFTALTSAEDQTTLRTLYHRGTQAMSVLILPIASVIAFYSFDILLLWTGNLETAKHASVILSLLVIGTALNSLMHMPYVVQLAHGWTSIGLKINIFFIVTMVPFLIFMTSHFGSVGAAAVWAALNLIFIAIGVPLTHQRLLKGEASRWYIEDVGLPLTAAVLVAGLSRMIFVSPMSRIETVIVLVSVLLGAFLITGLAAKEIRQWVFLKLSVERSA